MADNKASLFFLQGHFYGRITACTSTVNDSILLHDSGLVPVGGGVMAADRGNDQFACVRRLRPVMAVCLQETMMVTVLAQVDGTETMDKPCISNQLLTVKGKLELLVVSTACL